MALKEKTLKVLDISEIPAELIDPTWWVETYGTDTYVQSHISDDLSEHDPVDEWILDRYPDLIDEESFLLYTGE